MKKSIVCLITGIVIIGSLSLVGCGQKNVGDSWSQPGQAAGWGNAEPSVDINVAYQTPLNPESPVSAPVPQSQSAASTLVAPSMSTPTTVTAPTEQSVLEFSNSGTLEQGNVQGTTTTQSTTPAPSQATVSPAPVDSTVSGSQTPSSGATYSSGSSQTSSSQSASPATSSSDTSATSTGPSAEGMVEIIMTTTYKPVETWGAGDKVETVTLDDQHERISCLKSSTYALQTEDGEVELAPASGSPALLAAADGTMYDTFLDWSTLCKPENGQWIDNETFVIVDTIKGKKSAFMKAPAEEQN